MRINESSRIFKAINKLWDNFVDKQILTMIDGTMQKKGDSFVYFCQLLKDALEIGFTRIEEATRVNKEFHTFFAVSSRWEFLLRFPKFVCFESKFPINYKNKHFFVHFEGVRVRKKFSSMDTCITITRTLKSNSREKSLEMQQNFL